MRSLRQALLIYIIIGVSLVVLIAGFAVWTIVGQNFQSQLDETLLDRANTLGSLVMEEDTGALELEYDQPMNEATVGVLVRITADDSEVIAQSPQWPVEYESIEKPSIAEPSIDFYQHNQHGTMRVVAIMKHASEDPGDIPGGGPGSSDRLIQIEVIGKMDGIQRAEQSVLVALLLGGLFAVIGSIVAVWLGIRHGLIPIRQLGSAVDQIDTHDLTLPSKRNRYPNELQPIVLALNGLLDRLRTAMERERRFTDAAAHELRTPIAELKTITDVADRWPEPDRLHRSIKDARLIVTQMENLLESLLAAARGETADDSQQTEPIKLLPLARTIFEDSISHYRQNSLAWSFDGDENATWVGQRGAILAIIRNLIENAAQYTPKEGSVHVSAATENETTTFEVENGPVTLESQEINRIFEPFWRQDRSRTDHTHSGLGLTIVDSLAGAMNLQVDATVSPERSLRITLTSNDPTAETE